MDFCATFRANFYAPSRPDEKSGRKDQRESRSKLVRLQADVRPVGSSEHSDRQTNSPFLRRLKKSFARHDFPRPRTTPRRVASRRLASSHVNPFSSADCHRDQRQVETTKGRLCFVDVSYTYVGFDIVELTTRLKRQM